MTIRNTRVVGTLCLLVAGLSLLAAPVAAQSVIRAAIDELNTQLLYVALPLTLFVELTLVYAVYPVPRQRRPDGGVEADVTVEVTAYQWGWRLHYPEANATSQSRLVLPANADVRLFFTSEDVIHSIHVPALGIKPDVFPGSEQVALTNVTETGKYRLYCAELCGVGHTRMYGTVDVCNESAYREWLDEQTEE